MRSSGNIAVLLTVAATTIAAGQSVAPLELNLRPFDQRVADVGLLSADLQIIPPTLEVPTSFDEVYRVPGRPDDLASIQGALTAIFPQTQATGIQTPFGFVPEIPAGTVFYIGQPSITAALSHAGALPGDVLRWNTRLADTRIATREQPTPPADVDPDPAERTVSEDVVESGQPLRINRDVAPAIRSDAEYRNRRIRELLREAERASRQQR